MRKRAGLPKTSVHMHLFPLVFPHLSKHTCTYLTLCYGSVWTPIHTAVDFFEVSVSASGKMVKTFAPLRQLVFLLHNLSGNIYLLWVAKKNPCLRGKTNEQINPCGVTQAASGHAGYWRESLLFLLGSLYLGCDSMRKIISWKFIEKPRGQCYSSVFPYYWIKRNKNGET